MSVLKLSYDDLMPVEREAMRSNNGSIHLHGLQSFFGWIDKLGFALVRKAALAQQAQPLTDDAVKDLAWRLQAAYHESGKDWNTAARCALGDHPLAQLAQPDDGVDWKAAWEQNENTLIEIHKRQPRPEQIAESLWRASGHFSADDWTLEQLQKTWAWDGFLKQADAVLALLAGCKVDPYSSRACERGTKCCTVYHDNQ